MHRDWPQVSTNGLERGLTMENVVIQNSIGYANVLLSIGLGWRFSYY